MPHQPTPGLDEPPINTALAGFPSLFILYSSIYPPFPFSPSLWVVDVSYTHSHPALILHRGKRLSLNSNCPSLSSSPPMLIYDVMNKQASLPSCFLFLLCHKTCLWMRMHSQTESHPFLACRKRTWMTFINWKDRCIRGKDRRIIEWSHLYVT